MEISSKDFSPKGLLGLMGWEGTCLPMTETERAIVNWSTMGLDRL